MDKGSRQISIVTLGKGMALVVRYRHFETDLERVQAGMTAATLYGAAGCRPSVLGPRRLIRLRSWAFRCSEDKCMGVGNSFCAWILASFRLYS